MAVQIQKAVRSKVRLKIALTGPSGSGKTFSALGIACGLGKRVLLIDTENESGSYYAGPADGKNTFEFDTAAIHPPYTVEKFVEGIQAAVDGKYDVLVIDSISHAWAGEGGLLQQKEALDSRPGSNSYTNWASITKSHETFKAWLLKVNIDLIVTMRSKQDYILVEAPNSQGKAVQKPVKVGLAPIQREGMEYEFGLVLDYAMDHSAATSKDRTGLFDGKLLSPDKQDPKRALEKLAEILLAWRDGALVDARVDALPDAPAPIAAPPAATSNGNGGAAAPEQKWRPANKVEEAKYTFMKTEAFPENVRRVKTGRMKPPDKNGKEWPETKIEILVEDAPAAATSASAPATTATPPNGGLARGKLVQAVIAAAQQFGLQGRDQIKIAKAKFPGVTGLSDCDDAQLADLAGIMELALASPSAKTEFLTWYNAL